MDDDFPKEFPRVWVAAGIFLAAIILAFVMVVFTSIRAHAQAQPLCAPASQIIPAWQKRLKESPIWEGVAPTEQGPVEFVLTQNPAGNWSLFTIRQGIACLVGAGKDGNPNELGKGV